MKNIILVLLALLSFNGWSCSPYQTPTAQHVFTATTLNITVTSTSPWQCCYIYEMELICQQANFSGVANIQPNIQVCKGSGSGSSSTWSNENYPVYAYPLTNLCPGVPYKYRVRERHINYSYWSNWSSVANFTIPGDPFSLSVQANPPVVCPPDCTTLSATSAASCGPVTYTWNQGLSTGISQTVCPTAPTTYTVTGSFQVPFCPSQVSQSASITVDVDSQAINGNVIANPPIICQQESSVLTVSGYYGWLQWQSSSDINGPFEDIPGATSNSYTFETDLSSDDTYFRVHIYTCTDEYTIPVLVQVFDIPQPDFNADNVCSDASYVFQNTTINNSPIDTWLWDFGNGNNSNLQSPSFFFEPGNYNVTLTASNGAGCVNDTTKNITVYPMPIADFEVANVCEGLNSQFISTSTVNPLSDITNYDWDFGNNGTVDYTTQNVSHSYSSEGVYSAALTVTTNHGCSNTYMNQTTVYPNPIANFSPSEVCLSVSSIFNDLSTVSNNTSNNNIVSWNWNFGEGNSSDMQNPSHTYDIPNTFNVNLSVITNNGCADNITIPVTVYPIPVASFSGFNVEGCSPVFPVINSNSTVAAPSSIINYNWEMSNGIVQNSSSPQFINSFINNGSATMNFDVTLTVTTNHGCVHTISEPNFINVYHNPIASFTHLPFYPTVLEPYVQFINNSLYADHYDWTFLGLGTSTLMNPGLELPEIAETHDVTLIVSTNEGCADTVQGKVTVQDITLFYIPNTFTPDFDDFNPVFTPVFYSGFEPLSYHLTIFNQWGNIVFESYDYQVGWDGTLGVGSTKEVVDGTYIWQISFLETMSDKRHSYRGHINLLK